MIAGERRWRACQLAGLTEIPAVIKAVNDEAALAMGIIENIQRADLNPVEEAQGYKRLVDEFGLTHENLAQAVGKSRSAISNSLRLLSLPEQIQQHINQGLLEMGHARALITLPVLAQLQLAEAAIKQAWSVREMERQAQAWQQNQEPANKKTISAVDSDVLRLQDAIADKLGLEVKIQANQQQKGKLVLHFNNADEFQQMLNALNLDQLA